MPDSPKNQRNENQTTFFVHNRNSQEETTRAEYEDKMITSAMGGPLPEQADASVFQRVLSVACGSGGWAIEAARRYPQMSLVGIDINTHLIDYACKNAVDAGVAERVQFQVMDALHPLAFPSDSFDLVTLRLGVTFMRTWEWPELIHEMLRVTRPGGVIRLTEPQIIHQNKSSVHNAGLVRWHNAVLCAMYRSGHLFEENTTGVTAHLVPLLTRFGCKDVQTRLHALEFKPGTPKWQEYYNNGVRIMQGSRSFLTKWGCIGDDYDALYQQASEEMRKPDYYPVWNFLTVWGKTPQTAHA